MLVLFQVGNQADCIKSAGDFLFPDHLEHCLQLTTEFREENLLDGPWMVDVLQVKCTVLHAYTNIQEQCLGLPALEYSDLPSATNFENHSMVFNDFQNSQQLIPLSSGHFPAPQFSGSSIPSGIDIQDDDMMDTVSNLRQDTPPRDNLSAKVS